MCGFLNEAIKELNEVLTHIEDILADHSLSNSTHDRLIKIKDVFEDVEEGLAHC